MRSLLQAAAFCAVSASAFVIPPSHPHAGVPNDAVAGSIAGGISAYFSTPCHGCFADNNEELEIEVKLEPSQLQCHAKDIVLNDVRLPLSPGSIQFKANTSTGSNASDINATWELMCLDNSVTVLTLQVNGVVGQTQLQQVSGFSMSFRQTGSPAFLRLKHEPFTSSRILEATEPWVQEQSDPDFIVVPTSTFVDQNLPDELQHQLRRLHVIKAQIGQLHHKYMRQEHLILDMIKEDFYACEGARCLVRTAFKKAPELFELIKAHFRHRPDWKKLHEHRLAGPHDPEDRMHEQGVGARPWGAHEMEDRPFHVGQLSPEHTPFPAPFDMPHREDSSFPRPHHPPPPPSDGDNIPSPPWEHDGPPPPWEHDGPPPPWKHDGPPPPWEHDGPPPPPPSPPPPEHHGDHPPPPPWRHHEGPGPHHPGHPHRGGHHRPPHHSPHFLQRYGPHHHPFFFSAGSLIFFAVIASLLFKCVRAKTGLFRNDKRKRDRAARREECRNRAAYRRAAMQHRLGRWWSQFRRPESTSDYEEKRARIIGQEETLEDVMQSEISDLRRAHEIVGDLMRAEEGRQRLYHEANFGSPSTSNYYPHALERQNTEASRLSETALPLYQPPPPSYDQELEGEMTVVDGFNYTPSATDSTPESSVVDCNSRMSFDTDTTVTK